MGTRRSRHNKGWKPLYKEHRIGIRNSDKRDRGLGHLTGVRLNREISSNVWKTFLKNLATKSALEVARLPGMPSATAFIYKRNRDPDFDERAAAVVASRRLHNSGRSRITEERWRTFEADLRRMPIFQALAVPGSPSEAAVYKRRELDPDFRRLMEVAPNGRLGIPKRPRIVTLVYPYIIMPRPEHEEILAINNIVPRTFPDQMRADICQEVMLAVLEGRTTIDELRKNRSKSAWFLRKFYCDNFEAAGRAVSFESMALEDRTYDEVASSIAAKEWHVGQVNEVRSNYEAFRSFQPPTQIEDVWRGQMHRKQFEFQASGLLLSFEEVAALMDQRTAA